MSREAGLKICRTRRCSRCAIVRDVAGVSAPRRLAGAGTVVIAPTRIGCGRIHEPQGSSRAGKGTHHPSGNVRIGDSMRWCRSTRSAPTRSARDIPIRSDGTRTIFFEISDRRRLADIQTGYAMVNGRRTVYIPVTKRRCLNVVGSESREGESGEVSIGRAAGVKVSYEFDQSPYVTRAITGLTQEVARAVLRGSCAALPARLAKRACRRQHPAGRAGGAGGVWISGQTVKPDDPRWIGAAVGILVDEATSHREHSHAHGRDRRWR